MSRMIFNTASKGPFKQTIHCSICDGTEINRDATAKWNEEAQEWEMSCTFDSFYCDDCGHEVEIIERLTPAEQEVTV